uniref:Protein FAR1-RELATED SEQUENCE n=1 Tax=Nelumbo nucifera TaxID=4432 RepID=A0A822YX22_NELNU|nr:TPA_asm: hypothetical protein HUJ06_007728 [Nelumbo nucifera]
MEIDLETHVDEHEMENVGLNADGDEHVMEDIGLNFGGNTMTDGEVSGEKESDMSSTRRFVVTEENVNLEPYEGMEFESRDEAYSFYREYARMAGFESIKKNSIRSKANREFISTTFTCSRQGKKKESGDIANQRPCYKIGCKASLHMKKTKDGKWVVFSFIKEHNHELLPPKSYYFRSYESTNSINRDNMDGLMHMMPMHNGEYLERDVENQRHLYLEAGDRQAMLEYFTCMQEENTNFFYAIDLDDEQRLRNVFWVDPKGRHDYTYFGDIVSFDTTYIKNRYRMPFVPFIGANHHFQPTFFGCALIADETKSTFLWIMRTWLRAMGGVAPKVLVTDQVESMKAAIVEIFPSTHHLFGLWHILGKIPDKLSHVIKNHENFMAEFNKCIYRSWTDEEFESQWWKIVQTFELGEDQWMKSLYEDRKKWAPTYMKDTFFAGMSAGQRSKTINSSFDKYLTRKTMLKEFFQQYKVFLQDRYEEESKAEIDTWHGIPTLKSHSPYEKQMSTIYTHEIFKMFQVEVLGIVACQPKKERQDGTTMIFRVQDFEAEHDFIVTWDESKSEISCLCHLFEYKGFLCRHAMVVFQFATVSTIPPHYILKQWTKDAKSRYSTRVRTEVVQSRVQRYNDLCQRALKLGEDGSISQESYNIAVCALEEAIRQCTIVNSSIKGSAGNRKSVKGQGQ